MIHTAGSIDSPKLRDAGYRFCRTQVLQDTGFAGFTTLRKAQTALCSLSTEYHLAYSHLVINQAQLVT